MKKIFYISASMLLFLLLSFILHAVIEISVISLLARDFDKYSLGINWQNWFLIHGVGTFALAFLGLAAGYFVGQRWWKYIYPHT